MAVYSHREIPAERVRKRVTVEIPGDGEELREQPDHAHDDTSSGCGMPARTRHADCFVARSMKIRSAIAVLLACLIALNPAFAEMSLLGVDQSSVNQPAAAGNASTAATPPVAPSSAGRWLGQFGSEFLSGLLHAIPDLIQQFKDDPLKTSLLVGGMLALIWACPPAALALGGVLLAKAVYDTGGDPARLGRLAGETALWAGLGIGAGRAFRGLRGTGTRENVVSPRMQENMDILRNTNPGGAMCFVAGTLVLTVAGLVPIERVHAGDVVVAYQHRAAQVAAVEAPLNVAASLRGAGTVARPVVRTFHRYTDRLVSLTLATAGGPPWTLRGTVNHPFYVPAADRYVEMGTLEAGAHLRGAGGEDVAVLATETRRGSFDVYNFEVTEAHNYHVTARRGAPAVLVHNTGAPGGCFANVPKQLWEVNRFDRIVRGPKGKIYRDPDTGLWWSKDIDEHGGSAWKVFTEEARGLRWFKDADPYGNYIEGKHKGPSGEFIPWSQTSSR